MKAIGIVLLIVTITICMVIFVHKVKNDIAKDFDKIITVEVTYYNGDKETIKVNTQECNNLYLYHGDFKNCRATIRSYVRNYTIISETKIP